jgi:hypothetical protein
MSSSSGIPASTSCPANCVAGLSERERTAVNSASDYLNEAIAKEALSYPFATVAGAFSGHEICSGSAWLHRVNLLSIGESYHPTAAGQSGGYLPAVTSAV